MSASALVAQQNEARAKAQAILDGAKNRDLTPDEESAIKGHIDTIDQLGTQLAAKARRDDLVSGLASTAPASQDTDERGGAKSAPATLGQAFVEGAAYQGFAKSFPSGEIGNSPVHIDRTMVGTMSQFLAQKAAGATLTTDVAHTQVIRMPTLFPEVARRTFLDLISRGQTGGNFEYMQVVAGANNAALVPETQLKPLSDFTTQMADAKVYTYADGYTVTNQLLADAPAMASYMDSQLRDNLSWVLEDKIINGSGTNGEPRGLMNTTGVQHQEIEDGSDAIAFVKAVRKAIGKVRRVPGGRVTGVVISAEDDEDIDLMQDANGRFFGAGPFAAGPSTLWGMERVVSDRLTKGQAVVGDLSQIALLDREGLSVVAFNQHEDFARRNLTYVRAELRAAQVIWRPDRLVVIG